MWGLVERAAVEHADHVLLADDHGRSFTGAALAAAAEGVAAALLQRGIRAGTRVSWQLPTTLEAIVVKLALARVGAVQNPIIPVLRERDVGFVTDQTQTEFFLVPEEWRGFAHGEMARELANERGFEVIICDHATDPTTTGGALRLPLGDSASLPPAVAAPDEIRWHYYSSGTTSVPKGARHTDPSIIASASGVIHGLGVRADDVYPIAFPVAHIGGVSMMVASLTTGFRFVAFDQWDPVATPERMAAHEPTILGSAVPFFLAFLNAQERHGAEPLYPRLRIGTGGGAPLPADLNRAMREAFGIRGICNSWGLTEFPIVTFATPDDDFEVLDTTVGFPVRDVEVRVVSDDDRLLGSGEEGELRLKGPQCFAGYVDPALDATAFDDDGWFRTGDLGLVDADGRVRVTGRLKEIVIRNAENISALEVEELLFRNPDIADAAVIGLPDSRTGERVCAVIVPVDGKSVGLDDLVEHFRSLNVAPYKIPEQVEVVDAIPRNAMGKALKNDLRARFSGGRARRGGQGGA
jgi:acyl-CoA synthetase (AMP-forming)/AMP-acid ligase II